MHGQLRQRADGPDQRRQLRGPDAGAARPRARRTRCGPPAEGRDAGAGPTHRRAVRWADHPQGNGGRQPRLPGRMVMDMELIVPIVIALVGIVIAWKLLKGLVKTVVLVGILVLAAVYVFGGGLS